MQALAPDKIEFPVTETLVFADTDPMIASTSSPRRSGWRAQPDNIDLRGWSKNRSTSFDRRRRVD